jgi:hypothetical protein
VTRTGRSLGGSSSLRRLKGRRTRLDNLDSVPRIWQLPLMGLVVQLQAPPLMNPKPQPTTPHRQRRGSGAAVARQRRCSKLHCTKPVVDSDLFTAQLVCETLTTSPLLHCTCVFTNLTAKKPLHRSGEGAATCGENWLKGGSEGERSELDCGMDPRRYIYIHTYIYIYRSK